MLVFFIYIPYQIYNIVKIVTEKKNPTYVEMQYNVVTEEPVFYNINNKINCEAEQQIENSDE